MNKPVIIIRQRVTPPPDPDPDPVLLEIITASALGDGEQSKDYGRALFAIGGVTPYGSWTVISGSLPPGLTLNASTGVLSGTPTTVGSYAFTVRVTDAASTTAQKAFTLTIQEAGAAEGPHDFFDVQKARPECFLHTSLRGPTATAIRPHDGHRFEYLWPSDPHPEAQDAARLEMCRSLNGNEQIRVNLTPYNLVTDDLLIITDFYWTETSWIDRMKFSFTHKHYNLRDGGDKGSGASIYFEPQADFKTTHTLPEIANAGLRHYGYGGAADPKPAGLDTWQPYKPTGLGAAAPESLRIKGGIWHRFWIYLRLSEPGRVFDSWNSQHSQVTPISTATIVNSVPDGATTVFHTATAHGLHSTSTVGQIWSPFAEITGHSNGALNTSRVAVEVIPHPSPPAQPSSGDYSPSKMTAEQWALLHSVSFRVATASSGGINGTVSKLYHMASMWMASETLSPTRVYYEVPLRIRGDGKILRFDHELNTSTTFVHNVNGPSMQGWFIASPPTIASPTVIHTSAPHDLVTGHPTLGKVRIETPYSASAPEGLGLTGYWPVTVIDSTHFSIPLAVTQTMVAGTSGGYAGTYGYVAKMHYGYARNTVFLKNLAVSESDTSLFARPVR